MNDRTAKGSTFSKYAKGLLSRPTVVGHVTEQRNTRSPPPEAQSEPAKTQDICYSAESPISAIAASPDRQNVVIAGREILKVLAISQYEAVETHNLRRGNRVNLSYASNDVKWGIGPTSTLVATANSNGSIVTWNVEYASSKKIERVLSGHNRAVNRLAFNPGNGSWLLSASQDGSMKLWDLREPEGSARFALNGKAEAVRDVDFNSTNALELAAVYDNGTLQKWDLRNPKIYERKLNAHHGLALALDWHADGRHLVTGGRDKIIKIWDLGSDMRKPISFIHAMAPVARVAWRPGNAVTNCQIASCSFSLDNTISLWNLRRPNLPSRTFEAHEAVATGILWQGQDTLWSCSKDQTFRQHNIETARDPIDFISHHALGWSNTGGIAICLGNSKADKAKFAVMENRAHSTLRSQAEALSEVRHSAKEKQTTTEEVPAPMESHLELFAPAQAFSIIHSEDKEIRLFHLLAERYDVTHTDPIRSCARNAQVAYKLDQQRASSSWKLIKSMLEQAKRFQKHGMSSRSSSWNYSISNSKMGESLIHRDLERLRGTPRLSESGHSTMRANSPAASFIMPRYSETAIQSPSVSNSAAPSRPRTADSMGGHTPRPLSAQATQDLPVHNAPQDPDGIILPDPADLYKHRSDSWASTDTTSFSIEPISAAASVARSPSPSPSHSTHSLAEKLVVEVSEMLDMPARTTGPLEQSAPSVLTPKTMLGRKEESSNELCETVAGILAYFQELGDVQMCSTVCLVLTGMLDLPEKRVDNWLYSYVELLHKQKLFTTAAEVVNSTDSSFVRSLYEGDTVVQTSCARCRKAVPLVRETGDYWMCSRCQNTVLCIVCGTVVRKSAMWCRACNHTAHAACRGLMDMEFGGLCVAPDCHCECAVPPVMSVAE